MTSILPYRFARDASYELFFCCIHLARSKEVHGVGAWPREVAIIPSILPTCTSSERSMGHITSRHGRIVQVQDAEIGRSLFLLPFLLLNAQNVKTFLEPFERMWSRT